MWLHLPRSIASVCAPESADWISPCNWPLNSSAGSRELFVTLSGKPTPRPLSWRGWKTRPWMMRLSGMTFAPSTASRGVAAWIASLPATPASLSVAPANDWLNSIRATFGPRWIASLARHNLGSSSSKMLAPTFDWGSEVSAEISKEEATLLRLDCSRRQKLGQAMSANGSSSWPTAKAGETGQYQRDNGTKGKERPNLTGLSKAFWTTPQAHDVTERGSGQQPCAKAGNACLARDARLWNTPQTSNVNGVREADGKRSLGLNTEAAMWSTPRSSANENRTTKHAPSHGHGHGRTLAGDAMTANWPTPGTPRPKDNENTCGMFIPSQNQVDLTNAAHHFFHPAPETLTDGGTSSPETPSSPRLWLMDWTKRWCACNSLALSDLWHPESTSAPVANPPASLLNELLEHLPKRRLNPQFVEFLMGWPVGWTDCASPVTGLSLWKSRMRSSLWRLLKQWDN